MPKEKDSRSIALDLFASFWLGWTFFAFPDPMREAGRHRGVVSAMRADDYHSFVVNNIFSNILTVIAAAHFYHDDYFTKLSIDFYIAQSNNIVG